MHPSDPRPTSQDLGAPGVPGVAHRHNSGVVTDFRESLMEDGREMEHDNLTWVTA